MSQSTKLQNLHATALTIGDRGVLIRGESGSGKTALALALIASAHSAGRNARLVSDDQVLLSAMQRPTDLYRTPPTIAGLVEVRGATPKAIHYEPSAIIDLLVDLVEAAHAPRFREPQWEVIAGCRLPVLKLAARNVHGALPALGALLSLPPFV